MQGNVSMQVM